jgi:hypothetical protein
MRDSTWWRQRYGGPPPTPIAIVCTGRDKHSRTVLPGVHVFIHSGHVELSAYHHGIRVTGAGKLEAGEPGSKPQRVRVPRTGECTREALDAADAWEFSCPRCGRTPRVRKAVLADAARLGVAEVDVSFVD